MSTQHQVLVRTTWKEDPASSTSVGRTPIDLTSVVTLIRNLSPEGGIGVNHVPEGDALSRSFPNDRKTDVQQKKPTRTIFSRRPTNLTFLISFPQFDEFMVILTTGVRRFVMG